MRPIAYLILLSLVLPSSAAASAAERRVVVGFPQNAPLIFTDTDGQVKGIVADLLSYIADREGWKLYYLPGTLTQCNQRLENGTIDLIPGIAKSVPWEAFFDYCNDTIVVNWGQLYVRPGTSFSDILAFNGKAIAVVEADIYYQYLKTLLDKFDIHPQFVKVEDYGSVLSMVQRNKVAAGVVPRLYGAYYEKHFRVVRSPISFKPTDLHFAVAKGRNMEVMAVLDRQLEQLKANPNSLFYQSLDQWTQGVRKVSFPLWIKPLWVLMGIIGIMALVVLGNIILRRQIKRQTEALKATIAAKEKIESELTVAREIQLQLVPQSPHGTLRRKEFDIYATLEPAREVGGDFYDYFFIDRNSFCLIIGDVSGKGVPAALFMAMSKTMLKSSARLLVEPEYILADVNREISRNNPSLTFVTVFIGVLDLRRGTLTYASAGHNPPLLIGEKGNSVLLGEAQCPALGLDETFQYHQASIQLNHREGLLLYTDGVIEAQDHRERLFTQEALMNAVSMTAALSPKDRISAVLSRVREFTGNRPLDDDLTLVALTYFSPDRVEDDLRTVYLKNDLNEISRLNETVEEISGSVGCPTVVAQDIALALEEIFSNIVFYGFGDELEHTIIFQMAVEAGA
ncbi:SpoIIE family protein phosphatase [Desulfosarcina cetonica]|uniref:SpoIIE family protein phosphatase n=1 Tax=Desulfosarcina cetonica TaxID=90730 RepID=UPI0006CF624D|nr:SpoIIE family protein phosphatase [Desulfosarcina cetonica]